MHGRGRTAKEMRALAERIALPEMAWLAVDAPGQSWYPQRAGARERSSIGSAGYFGGTVGAHVETPAPTISNGTVDTFAVTPSSGR